MTLSPGSRLGPYEILSSIGSGGMGEVWKARDTRLGRTVAIKVLLPKYASDTGHLTRFEREAKATAALSHPNILAVHDVGTHDGSPYLVEELLEGESLKVRLGKDPFPLKETLDIAVQITRGLEAAHEKGIIHRDLKPANIFITSKNKIVKILDFGLAKLMELMPPSEAETLSGSPTGISETGCVLGTVGYMSPEQARGRNIDQRSDIFSFGCLLYEMVTGLHAFRRENNISTMAAILDEEPELPSKIGRKIPLELERAILKCLQKEPAQRFQSAAELRQWFESYKMQTFSSRFQVKALFSGSRIRNVKWVAWVLLFFLAIWIVVSFRGQTKQLPIPEQKNLVVLPITVVGGGPDQVYCDGMTETVTTKLAGIHGLQVLPVSQVKQRNASTPEIAKRELGANLVLRVTWQRAERSVRINMNLLDSRNGLALRSESITASASDPFGLQDRVVDRAVRMLDVTLQKNEARDLGVHGTEHPSAYDYFIRGLGYLQDYTQLSNIQSAVSVFQQALKEDPQYALALAGLGHAYWRGYLLTHESDWLADAFSACRRSLETDSSLADGHACLGVVYIEKGEYQKAVEELERAVRLNPNADDFMRGLASAYQKLGKIEDAENTFKDAIALRPQYWANYSYLGAFYFSRGREWYGEAAAMFEQVIKLAPDSFRGYYNLGGIYVAMDRLDEALPVLERSIRIYPTAAAYNNLGTVYLSRRQFPEAVSVLEKAVQLEERYAFWSNLGEAIFFIPERHSESIKPFQEAIRLAQARLNDSPYDRDALSSMVYFEAMTGAHTTAQSMLDQALQRGIVEPAQLLRLAKAASQLGDDKQTFTLIKNLLAVGGTPSAIMDAPHFDSLRARSQRLRELLKNTGTQIPKGEGQ